MVRRLENNMGPDAMRAATGRDHEQWRALLTDAGGVELSHSEIARLLVDEHGVDPWWAQGITVDFEQACKGRLPGQRADGTFAVARTATLDDGPIEALIRVQLEISARHGQPHGQNLDAKMPVFRWRLDDGTRLQAAAQSSNKSGTPINVTWERLPSPEAMESAREQINEIFEGASRSRPEVVADVADGATTDG